MRKAIIGIALLCTGQVHAGDTIDGMLNDAADRYGVPRDIVRAVAWVESTKTCGARNGGSRGIMQVQKGAAKEVGVKWPFQTCEDEIEAGVKYLKLALDKGGQGCRGVTLYNTGIMARPHCSKYGQKVMSKRGKV